MLIVGGGEFGSTAALALAEGPYRGHGNLITVLERGAEPPAVDAASSDYNKIVRADYADPLYQSFAIEAIEQWRTPRWKKHFHECGVVVAAAETDPQAGYVVNSHRLNKEEDVGRLERAGGIKRFYSASIGTGEFSGDVAYKNKVGGWAASRDAVVEAINLARKLGVTFVSGEAESLIICPGPNGSDVKGVQTVDGREYRADFVIVACGSWTPKLLPELATNCLPTGQTVATVQLSKEEVEKHKDMPVRLSVLRDGLTSSSQPNKDGIVKMAIHDRGWLAPSGTFPSLPRTTLSSGYERQQIPTVALDTLRRGMRRMHPELAEKEIVETRLCWYSDRESGDFLFDWHPTYPSLFVAAGGSGHAFSPSPLLFSFPLPSPSDPPPNAEFLPLTGNWIVSALTRTLPPHLQRLWSFTTGDKSRLDKSRGEGPIVRRDLDTGVVREIRVPAAQTVKAKL
ncbi:FAD dependent oxidoreductase [Rhodotorula toruloides]|uniref:FAD dependent oxidoreductase n=1 Tax=Rhodotorula toruloides TaxID=5286 RepID=A0A2S9ZYL6_RHOTO|nr:FAD dependent oxidoreductase [Rhodotorula toruloides]